MRVLRILLLLLLSGCLDADLSELAFFTVVTEPATPSDVGTITLTGQINDLGQLRADSCGFVWTEAEQAILSIEPNLNTIRTAVPEGSGQFQTAFQLRQGQVVFFRAWAALGQRRVYGQVEAYSLDQIVVMSTGTSQVHNDSATVSGRLIGVAQQQAKVYYGHVYSADVSVSVPALGLPDCMATAAIETLEDKVFVSGLSGLAFNTTYRVRAYAIGQADTFYSQVVDTFRVRDGWKRIGEFQNYKKGAAVVAGGFGFAGFGCGVSTDCFQHQLSRDFFRFDPAVNGGAGGWQAMQPFDGTGIMRSNTVMFAIADTVYVLFGDFKDANGTLLTVTDCWKYAPASNQWFPGKDVPFVPGQPEPFRTAAVGFVAQGKAYVGTGNYVVNQQPTGYRNDFWEYNPATGSWRRVAGLPIRVSEFDTKTYYSGRAEAVAFAVGDSVGYVGGGETNGGLQLKDFWKFSLPTTAADTGRWVLTGFFPGKSRLAATVVSDGRRAWYGLGYNTFDDYLNDWWEFDPAQSTWQERTAFQGTKRADAFSFSIGNKHYIGTGSGKMLNPNGTAFLPRIDSDFWLYTPEE